MKLPHDITIGEKYNRAMTITDQKEADAYLSDLVIHCMGFGTSADEAIDIEKSNLGYYAGYFDHETRLRVEKLFKCKHPILGDASKGEVSPRELFELGYHAGSARRKEIEDGKFVLP